MSAYTFLCMVIGTTLLLFRQATTQSVQLSSANIDGILQNTELVFINFYADWCRFSQMLSPIYDETAGKMMTEFPERGRMLFAKVDCDRESAIGQRFHVSKYPTLKLVRYGELVKKEYRGQRSVDSISEFIRQQLSNPIEIFDNLNAVDNLDRGPRHIIGYYDSEASEEFRNFKKIAGKLRDDCKFHAAFGAVSEKARAGGNKVLFRSSTSGMVDISYEGNTSDYEILLQWATDKCTPLVREITFENAEELTEEGLPFMILFYHPKDTTTPEIFRQAVAKELVAEKSTVNFLTADGLKFSHPLQHLGKGMSDLPILAIDSFRHMYLWKQDPKTQMATPGLLKQFIADLHSGKLHREFHHGPDPGLPQVGQRNLPGHGNQPVMRIQQQIVMRSDGVQLKIMRIVKVDPGADVDIPAQLAKIMHDDLEAAVADSEGGNGGSHEEQGGEKTKDVGKKPEPIEGGEHHEEEVDKLVKVMAGGGADTAEQRQKIQASLGKKESPGAKQQGKPVSDSPPKVHNQHQKVVPHSKPLPDGKQDSGRHHGHDSDHKAGAGKESGTLVHHREEDVPVDAVDEGDIEEKESPSPPPSMFRSLGPSRQRYTLLRDEL